MSVPVPVPAIQRRQFPALNYGPRGAPKRNEEKFTTFGYKLSLVPIQNHSVGLGRRTLEQCPRPVRPVSRVRFDAYLIRPERSLSIKQIVSGHYFARPDPQGLQRLLEHQHLSASKVTLGKAEQQRQLRAKQLAAQTAPNLVDTAPDNERRLMTSASAPVLGEASERFVSGGALWKEL